MESYKAGSVLTKILFILERLRILEVINWPPQKLRLKDANLVAKKKCSSNFEEFFTKLCHINILWNAKAVYKFA